MTKTRTFGLAALAVLALAGSALAQQSPSESPGRTLGGIGMPGAPTGSPAGGPGAPAPGGEARGLAGWPHVITVVGEGEVRVEPDMVSIALGVENTGKDLDQLRAANEEAVKKALALAKELGIADKDVQTDRLRVEPRYGDYDKDRRTREFLGYFIERNVTITLRDLSKFEELMGKALKLGVNQVSQGEFRSSKVEELQAKARELAATSARTKAQGIVAALGRRLGQPIAVGEEGVSPPMPMPRMAMSAPMAQAESAMAPGEIVVRATLRVTFEMQ